jgi:menaquinone-dependent protoporphyrinogen oxidase
MANTIDIFYASHDGQTRRIVEALASHLAGTGATLGVHDLADGEPSVVPGSAEVTVLAAPIRYGRPLPIADRFLRRIAPLIDQRRFALVLVSLSARKPGRDTPAGNPPLRRWMARRGVDPAIARAVAGRLAYPDYTWYDRAMIRLIMTISKGPTDPTLTVDFTDWRAVETLAAEIAALGGTRVTPA